MTEAFDLLTQGKFFQAILYPYQATVGTDVFYLILLSLAIGLIYVKTKSVGLVGITLMLGGSVLIPVITPDARIYFLAIIMVGVALSIYNLVWRKYG